MREKLTRREFLSFSVRAWAGLAITGLSRSSVSNQRSKEESLPVIPIVTKVEVKENWDDIIRRYVERLGKRQEMIDFLYGGLARMADNPDFCGAYSQEGIKAWGERMENLWASDNLEFVSSCHWFRRGEFGWQGGIGTNIITCYGYQTEMGLVLSAWSEIAQRIAQRQMALPQDKGSEIWRVSGISDFKPNATRLNYRFSPDPYNEVRTGREALGVYNRAEVHAFGFRRYGNESITDLWSFSVPGKNIKEEVVQPTAGMKPFEILSLIVEHATRILGNQPEVILYN